MMVRRQGSGTFAAEPKFRQDASHLRGRPVEHARDLYRGDRNRFITELTL